MNEDLIRRIVSDMQAVMSSALKVEYLTKEEQTTDEFINLALTIVSSFAGNLLINIHKGADFFNIHKAILTLTTALHTGMIEKEEGTEDGK